MAIIKCKMCGGDLEITAGQSVAECEYCGSRQTIPSVDNEKKLTMFSRANRLRMSCEFDKAAGIYEALVADFPQEAEAYWGLVLCKYGIEYVDDPGTGRKIPTCHRSSFDSIMDDTNLEQALENADAVARKVYRDEAKQIEELRKGIIEVSGREEPYDIFICYKETDENKERTLDSVLAQDVYDALTAKGYRVFFSRVTLEDKLGVEYEPYIFAALNSAKIMLAFGTDYEYFNAVWVKNEWSRYLQLMTQDKSKHLIPCYKGLDAYDMPKEFARLQAQDLGKVGATQDLLRGIEKLLPREEKKSVVQQVVTSGGANVQALLDRGNMALEDGEWNKAAGFFDRALDNNAQCAEGYLGKAMVDFKVSNLAALAKAMDASRFSPEVSVLQAGESNEKANQKVVELCVLPPYLTEKEIRKALEFSFDYRSYRNGWAVLKNETLKKLGGNRNLARAAQYASEGMKQQITATVSAIRVSFEKMEQQAQQEDQAAKEKIQERYNQHLKELTKVRELRAKAETARKEDYENAMKLFREDCCQSARKLFEKTAASDYLESQRMIGACDRRMAQIAAEEAAEQARREAEEKAEAERLEAIRRKKAAEQARKNKTVGIISAVAMVAAIAIFLVVTKVIIPGNKYSAAEALLANGQYEEAIEAFEALGSYKDSPDRAVAADAEWMENWDAQTLGYLNQALELLRAGDVAGAAEAYRAADESDEAKHDREDIPDKDAATAVPGMAYPDEQENAFSNVPAPEYLPDIQRYIKKYSDTSFYKASSDEIKEARYQFALELMATGHNGDALEVFARLRDYRDSKEKIYETRVAYIADKMMNGDFTKTDYLSEADNETDYHMINALYSMSQGDFYGALEDHLSRITDPSTLSPVLDKVILHYLAKLPEYREETTNYSAMTTCCLISLNLIADQPQAQEAITHYAERVVAYGGERYYYDAQGRLTGTDDHAYEYDEKGVMTGRGGTSSFTLTRDSRGRITRKTYSSMYWDYTYSDGLVSSSESYTIRDQERSDTKKITYKKNASGQYTSMKIETTQYLRGYTRDDTKTYPIEMDESGRLTSFYNTTVIMSNVYFANAQDATEQTMEEIINFLMLDAY